MKIPAINLNIFLIAMLCINFSCENNSKSSQNKSFIQSSAKEVFEEGQEIPEFEFKNIEGENVSYSDFKGKYILLNFWASWCVPCIKELPSLNNLHNKLKEHDFEVVSINVDPPGNLDSVKSIVKKHDLGFEILLDSELHSVENFRVSGFPETFLINPEGKFQEFNDPDSAKSIVRILSDREWDKPEYIAAIKKEMNIDP